MTPATDTDAPPSRLLLATDLSARCDRALDRAAQLAGEWRAELVALTVVEAPQAPDLILAWAAREDDERAAQVARQQLEGDLEGLGIRTSVRVVRGDAANVIPAVAASAGCELIVTGMARNETLGRFLLGSTVEALARTASQPLLVVRNRVRGPYRRVVAATDFSDASRDALRAAVRLFPDRDLTLFHACTIPMSGHAHDSRVAAIRRHVEEGECAAFLAATDLPADVRRRLRVVVEVGATATTLTRHVRERGVDLVVTGAHGRRGALASLIGSTAQKLIDWLPCDTMIARAG
ncbi:Universal stress protein/MSMEI_3859 [Burkholderiales bacterium]|nr:Universal stress protein/MSMEI_3859 [Burkholderiales bacterium]